MAQKSLPRLEKINKCMSWEASLFYDEERWANPKLFLVNKLLMQVLFKKTLSVKHKYWFRLSSNRYWGIFFKNFNAKNTNFFKKQNIIRKHSFLGSFLYYSDNRYVNMVVYSYTK